MRRRPSETVTPPEVDVLFSVAYEELRRLAARVRGDDPSATMNPTALVNEAWLKLAGAPDHAFTSVIHFKRVAARAMRQVLVEAARRRRASKRGGGGPVVVFDEALGPAAELGGAATSDAVLALDDALESLARQSVRQAQVVEARFFGGYETAEIAALLDVSEATVLRDWRAARAWLSRELARG